MSMTIKKELKTKSGTFKIATGQDGTWSFGFAEENSVETSYMFISKPLALFLLELFDFLES